MVKIFFSFLIFFIYTIDADSIKYDYPSLQWHKSAEYGLLCSQVYQSAQHEFEKLDLNKAKSVMVEGNKNKNLPLAIIADIDETILLNYDLQKKTLENNIPFSYDLFEKYINLSTEIPINGSIKYFQYLSKKGVKIIYISNRHTNTEDQTYKYLKKYGYPIDSKDDLLLKFEQKDWVSNKSSRRVYITQRYTVIQMFGDNLRDFVQTEEEALKYKDNFGKSWFLLPNPVYGSWLKDNL
jgi:acid phosphatase